MLKACVFLCMLCAAPRPAQAVRINRRPEPAEVATHDTPATFRAKVNLVLIPVVVRDGQSRAVGNLTKDDFRVFDMGKPQAIASFSREAVASRAPQPPAPSSTGAPSTEAPAMENKPAAPMPDRFVAYLFDDVHLSAGDLAQVRAAAERQLNDSFAPTDRAAIFSTSGRTRLDFTDDHAKWHETLLSLRPEPVARPQFAECPDVSYYAADLIVNKNDQTALNAAANDALACMSFAPWGEARRTPFPWQREQRQRRPPRRRRWWPDIRKLTCLSARSAMLSAGLPRCLENEPSSSSRRDS